MTYLPPQVLIVGAGPAGLLLAHYLLARQYQVKIYERRSDPRMISPDQQRSFPIALHERGRNALREIPGLMETVASHSGLCKGMIIHQKKGAREVTRENVAMPVDRNQLVLTLLEQLTARYAEPVLTLQFDCKCECVDDEQQFVQFQTSDGEQFSVHYDRLVGADGARSSVRKQLENHYELGCIQSYTPDAYKSIYLARNNRSEGVEFAANKMHSTNIRSTSIGKTCRVILAPQPDDRLHGAMFFLTGQNPLANLETKEAVLDYFETHLPMLRPLISSEEAEALLHRPTARLATVKCDRFHQGDHILLIGDAIHAVSPSVGQGCNASLEDVTIINRLLDRYQDNWSQAIAQFSKERVADAHALGDLADYSFPRTAWLVPEFVFRLTIGRKLHQWFPHWFAPCVFDAVLDSSVSYSEVLRLNKGWIERVKRSTQRLNLVGDTVDSSV